MAGVPIPVANAERTEGYFVSSMATVPACSANTTVAKAVTRLTDEGILTSRLTFRLVPNFVVFLLFSGRLWSKFVQSLPEKVSLINSLLFSG